MQKFQKYFFGRPRKFSKLSNEEIFQHFQFQYLEEFILMDKDEFAELKNRLLENIEIWKTQYLMRGITCYSILHKKSFLFKHTQMMMFYWLDENEQWNLIISDLNKNTKSAQKFSNITLPEIYEYKKFYQKRELIKAMEKHQKKKAQ